MNILHLPSEYLASKADGIDISPANIGRLSLAGLLDLKGVFQDGSFLGPTPLILVDGRPAKPDEEVDDYKRRFYYGPSSRLEVDSPNPPVELVSNNWAFCVDIPYNPFQKPSSYLGHGIYPHEAVAKIFRQPLPYQQEVFAEAVMLWTRELNNKA